MFKWIKKNKKTIGKLGLILGGGILGAVIMHRVVSNKVGKGLCQLAETEESWNETRETILGKYEEGA